MQVKYKVNFEFNKKIDEVLLNILTGFGWPDLYSLYSDKSIKIFEDIGERLSHINKTDRNWWGNNIKTEVAISDCDSAEYIQSVKHDETRNVYILTIKVEDRPTEQYIKNTSQRFKYYMNEVVPALLEKYMEQEKYMKYFEDVIGCKIEDIDAVKIVSINIEEEITINVKHTVEI
jgi:hypothetical protein